MRVGIDLGTTNTLVSYVDENGTWKLLKFEHSGRRENPYFLPSCLAIKNGSIIVGQPAIDYCLEHPDLFLSNTKYDMGKTGTVYHLENYAITPQEAAQHILNEVYKELTFQFPRETTFNAFVTVPARFGNEARQTTKAALISSNFETDESCLTDEPIAAAVAYSSMLTEDNLVLVVDIGGGTFDLSLLKTSMIGSVVTNRLEPVAWNGELRLGGNDVDEILIKKMAQKFLKDSGIDLYAVAGAVFPRSEETIASALIRAQAFQLKSQMYSDSAEQASVYIPDLLDGYALDFTISKEEYVTAVAELTAGYSRAIQNLFVGSNYRMSDIDHILVVGGMAHEVCLLNLLKQLFGQRTIIVPEDSMMLVCKGAAICNSNQKVHIENKAYTSIGLLKNGRTSVEPIIKQGSAIKSGTVFSAIISPDKADATAMNIEIVEYLGEFSPKNFTTILTKTIQLTRVPTKKWKLFSKLSHPKLKLNVSFSEDKILQMTVIQDDGTESKIDVRLGGN